MRIPVSTWANSRLIMNLINNISPQWKVHWNFQNKTNFLINIFAIADVVLRCNFNQFRWIKSTVPTNILQKYRICQFIDEFHLIFLSIKKMLKCQWQGKSFRTPGQKNIRIRFSYKWHKINIFKASALMMGTARLPDTLQQRVGLKRRKKRNIPSKIKPRIKTIEGFNLNRLFCNIIELSIKTLNT